jgi:CRP/FNR family transcriptional regulator, cyclic AMP receptor protein
MSSAFHEEVCCTGGRDTVGGSTKPPESLRTQAAQVEATSARRFGELLRGGRWFASLTPEFQKTLLDAATVRRLAKDEWLFARGDLPSGLFAVVEGGVRIAATAANGKEVLLALVEPPMWFGEISVLDGRPRTHDAIGAEPSTLVGVSQAALDAILEREPRHWRALGTLAAGKLRLMFGVVEGNAVLTNAMRLASLLVLAAERYGEWQGRSSRVVDLRQEQLAAMLATSRQTVNQVLKEFEAQGLIKLSYGQVEIVDLDGLRGASVPASHPEPDG